MFKDEYLLDYINVDELGMHDEDVDERVIVVFELKNDYFMVGYLARLTTNGRLGLY